MHAELGADARIIGANKIRSGGIGGFFSREVFEVFAAPGGDPAAAPPVMPSAPLDLDGQELLALMGARLDSPPPATPPSPATEAPTAAAEAHPTASGRDPGRRDHTAADPSDREQTPTERAAARPRPGADDALGDIAERIAAATAGRPDPAALAREAAAAGFEPLTAPGVATTAPRGFDDVLQHIARDAGQDVAAAVDQRLAPQIVAQPPSPAATPSGGLVPVGPQATTRAEQAARIAASRHRREATQGPVVERQRPTPAAQQVAAPAAERIAAPAAEQPAASTDGAGTEPTRSTGSSAPETADGGMLVARGERDVDMTVRRRTQRLLTWLEHDELPRTTLVTALRGLPSAPDLPDTTGIVVAIVGPRREALRIAKRLAKQLGVRARDVVLASDSYRGTAFAEETLLRTSADARRDRSSWRRREQPTIVAVDASTTPRDAAQDWTREVLDELEPYQVVGLADAAAKNSDLAAWARAIGGVDALAVFGTERTTSPYEVLALEVPVAWLDGEPATPDRWADRLLEAQAA